MGAPNQPVMYCLESINKMERGQFIEVLGDIFEYSPEVAEVAWAARPFASVSMLHDAMMASVERRDRAACKDFLRRHPELSAEAVRRGGLTAASVEEQKSAGLESLSQEEECNLQAMNREYRQRHGFPFIICVRHYTKEGIFFELEKRLTHETAVELACALNQVRAITRRRLLQRVS